MTEDEILNMDAGEEIDKLIAEKVMGWHVATNNYGFKSWDDSNGRFQHGVANYNGFEDEEDFHILHWHPSESILWAYEVLATFKDNTFGIYWENITGIKEWTVVLKPVDSYSGGFPVSAETLPLAICRAALLTILGDDE